MRPWGLALAGLLALAAALPARRATPTPGPTPAPVSAFGGHWAFRLEQDGRLLGYDVVDAERTVQDGRVLRWQLTVTRLSPARKKGGPIGWSTFAFGDSKGTSWNGVPLQAVLEGDQAAFNLPTPDGKAVIRVSLAKGAQGWAGGGQAEVQEKVRVRAKKKAALPPAKGKKAAPEKPAFRTVKTRYAAVLVQEARLGNTLVR